MINRPMPVPKDFLTTLPNPRTSGAHRPRTQRIPMPPAAARDGPKAPPAA